MWQTMTQFLPADTSCAVTGSDRMIQNQLQLVNEVKEIAHRLDILESEQQTLIKGQEYIVRTLNQVLKKLTDKSTTTKKPPAQKLSNTKHKTPSTNDVSKLLHLPQALQKNINKFTENVLFNPTNIPDELISSECLSEDECSTIAAKSSYKDQVRLLIRKIKARGPHVIEKFLEIVGKDHPDLPQEVNKSLEVIVNASKQKPVCVICVMRSAVDLKDVGDELWKAEIISDDVYEDIMECESIHRNKAILWDNIINSINNSEQPNQALDILVGALESKYRYIVEYLRETPERPSLSCSCCRRRRVRPRPNMSEFGSQTDLSTTSEIPRTKLPKTVYMEGEYTSEESRSVSLCSSQEVLSGSFRGISFDLLDRYDSIGSNSDRVFSKSSEIQDSTVSSTTDNISNRAKDRNRHSSGHFVPHDHSHDVMDNNELNRSIPLISEPPGSLQDRTVYNIGERPELKQSISMHSNVTVCASHSTSSADATHGLSSGENQNNRSSQSTDGVSPDGVQGQSDKLEFPKDVENESTKETAKESDDEGPLYLRQKAYRRRRQKSSSDNVPDDDEDDDNYITSQTYVDRARQWRYHRKRFARQRSVPHGEITLITNPRPQPDQTASNVGVRTQESRKSKQSMKRELRRQRSQGKAEFENQVGINVTSLPDLEDKGMKKPFNPLWGKDFTQPKLTPKWDHNQAKRYWQMSQLYATSARAERVKSDTDLRTEELSDTMAFSDFTA
ncbi:uncharacterized protein LOC123564275 [Mercenaria mercenaria]|uniref:uncharacterized protein LOC123564275 n=1 Tax=Mercenaria mercenaria TaxID=6596 RepID=UPI00234EB4C7|nr:uncharacterized protein LOC123564275 [Mercenaria mercenaria]